MAFETAGLRGSGCLMRNNKSSLPGLKAFSWLLLGLSNKTKAEGETWGQGHDHACTCDVINLLNKRYKSLVKGSFMCGEMQCR